MPKLLSRSKHEKFESNSALQIRDQKERRAKNARKLKLQFGRLQKFRNLRNFATCEFSQPANFRRLRNCNLLTLCILCTVPPAACSPAFHAPVFLLHFFVSSYFNPCNSFCLGLFCNFPYTEHLYKPQSVQTLYQSTSINKVTGEASYSPAWLLLSSASLSFVFFSIFSAAKHPLMMKNQRMFD